MEQRALPHLREDVEVEEVHATEDEQHGTDLGAQRLDQLLHIGRLVAILQREGDVADINEIEADDEQMIDRVGQRLIAVKGIDKEETAILVQRAGDPDGEGHADEEIKNVGDDNVDHGFVSFCFCVFSID